MTLRARRIGIDEPDAWQAALAALPHGYWHGWSACRAASLSSGLPAWLYVCESADGRPLAACPYSVRPWHDASDIFTPTGFSGFAVAEDVDAERLAALHAHWRHYVAAQGYVCGYFALHPLFGCTAMHENLRTTNDLFVVDLRQGADAALAHAKWKVRRDVREWQESGAALVHDQAALAAFLQANYRPFMLALGANPAALWSDDGLRALCGDPSLLMAGVADAEGICAVYVLGLQPGCAEFLMNVSVRAGRDHTRALAWWAMQATAARGIPMLHLGGGIRRNDNLATAKRKFRPLEYPLQGAREIYCQATYAACCANAGVPPDSLEGFFPAYRQPSPKASGPSTR